MTSEGSWYNRAVFPHVDSDVRGTLSTGFAARKSSDPAIIEGQTLASAAGLNNPICELA